MFGPPCPDSAVVVRPFASGVLASSLGDSHATPLHFCAVLIVRFPLCRRANQKSARSSALHRIAFKVIGIDLLYMEGADGRNADVVIDHQFDQLIAVHKDDLR